MPTDDMQVTFVEAPGIGTQLDQCEVCGATLSYSGKGKHPRFCADHKTPGSRNAPGSTPPPPRGRGKSHKKATESEWSSFMLTVLIGGTYLVGRFAAGGHGLLLEPPPGMSKADLDAYAEALSMQADEAKPIAELIAKRATPSAVNKKAGWIIVNFLEIEEVGAALWSYGARIAPVIAARMQATPNPVYQTKTRKVREDVTAQTDTGQQNSFTNADIVAQARRREARFIDSGND